MSQIKVPAGLIFAEVSPPVSQMATFLLCSHMAVKSITAREGLGIPATEKKKTQKIIPEFLYISMNLLKVKNSQWANNYNNNNNNYMCAQAYTENTEQDRLQTFLLMCHNNNIDILLNSLHFFRLSSKRFYHKFKLLQKTKCLIWYIVNIKTLK